MNARWIILGIIALLIVIFGFSLVDVASLGSDVTANAIMIGSMDADGAARAIEPREWSFPLDYGAHPNFQTEWWYYTGNLETENGERFGYQFTIFRRAINLTIDTPSTPAAPSLWRSDQLYMAHFAVTDVARNSFYHEERFSRDGANLAGAQVDPHYRIWLEDWEILGTNAEATQRRISAQMGDGASVDFQLELLKAPALQGDHGLSAKSGDIGNASYYYSLSRLATTGTVSIGDQVYQVDGFSWMDHEFSTSALGENALGWDWFGLQFDDNREMMVGQIRLVDGGKDPYFGGLLINPDGTTQVLPAESITIESLATWESPHTGAVYPAGWNIRVDLGDESLNFTVTPQIADQELHGGDIAYWEGTVRITGDVTGYGYAELTGYVSAMTGRF